MNIKKQIKKIFTNILNIKNKKIHIKTKLNDLGVDSLDIIEITMEIEDIFNIKIPDEKIEQFITIKNIIDYVKKQI